MHSTGIPTPPPASSNEAKAEAPQCAAIIVMTEGRGVAATPHLAFSSGAWERGDLTGLVGGGEPGVSAQGEEPT